MNRRQFLAGCAAALAAGPSLTADCVNAPPVIAAEELGAGRIEWMVLNAAESPTVTLWRWNYGSWECVGEFPLTMRFSEVGFPCDSILDSMPV